MALIGIATSGTFSMILALPLELLPGEKAGTASGIVLSIGYLGSFLGPWVAGLIADALGVPAAMWTVAAITFASGAVVAARMTETLKLDDPD